MPRITRINMPCHDLSITDNKLVIIDPHYFTQDKLKNTKTIPDKNQSELTSDYQFTVQEGKLISIEISGYFHKESPPRTIKPCNLTPDSAFSSITIPDNDTAYHIHRIDYDNKYSFCPIDDPEDEYTASFLIRNHQKLKDRKIIIVIRDQRLFPFKKRLNSFQTKTDPVLNKINCAVNPINFAQSGYYRDGELLKCCTCRYETDTNEINQLIKKVKKEKDRL